MPCTAWTFLQVESYKSRIIFNGILHHTKTLQVLLEKLEEDISLQPSFQKFADCTDQNHFDFVPLRSQFLPLDSHIIILIAQYI